MLIHRAVQCAWCGLMKTGPAAGKLLPHDNECSHGICAECQKRLQEALERRRQERKHSAA